MVLNEIQDSKDQDFVFFNQAESFGKEQFLNSRFSCVTQFTSRAKDGLLRDILISLTAC